MRGEGKGGEGKWPLQSPKRNTLRNQTEKSTKNFYCVYINIYIYINTLGAIHLIDSRDKLETNAVPIKAKTNFTLYIF